MAYHAAMPSMRARTTTPIGVGRAVVPNAVRSAVTDRLGLGYYGTGAGQGLGFDGSGNGDGMGGIFDTVKTALAPIVGPAISAGINEFNRRATGAMLQEPAVQSAIAGAAKTQGAAMFQTAAPWLVGGLLLLLVMRR